MTTKRDLLVILTLVLLGPLLTSCVTGRVNTSSCGYPAEITVGNSTKKIPTGSCAGKWGPIGSSVHMKAGQTLTVHFAAHDFASVRSQDPKVLGLITDKSLIERYQALAPGVSEILVSPPIGGFCLGVYGPNSTMVEPCVMAKVTVTQSCSGKSAERCNSSQNGGATSTTNAAPQISPSVAALRATQSPLAILCKPGFFTKAQAHLFVQQFGIIECFRFTGENKWVVIGNGHSVQSNPPFPGSTRGGPIIAMEKCASSDWSCLDPSAVHNFANFTAYYPPDPPGDFLGNLYATAYGDLLSIDGTSYCPAAVFDNTNGKWYPKSSSEKLLENNPGSIRSLTAPSPVSGAKALAQKAPTATVSAC